MNQKEIKALLGTSAVRIEVVNADQFHVAVPHGHKVECMKMIRDAGGRADLITCAEVYNEHFVVWR